MINIGVIGCGDIALTAHFPAIQRSRRFQLTAISTRNKDRLEALQKQYSVSFATTDYRELLQREDVDAVIVATPPWVTPEITVAALEQGKHVLCEKPIAMTVQEAHAMDAAQKRTGRKLQVGMTYHHDPLLAKLREWVSADRLGSPLLMRVAIYDETWDPEGNPEHYQRIDEAMQHGCPSVHEGPHFLDWLHVVNSAEIRQITSYGFKTRPEFASSNYDISIVDYCNGDRAKIEMGWFLPVFPEFDFEVIGPKGIAAMDSHKRWARLTTAEATEEFRDPRGWWEHCFDIQMDRFADSIELDLPCRPNVDDAVYTMEATEAIQKSMLSGEPVVIHQ